MFILHPLSAQQAALHRAGQNTSRTFFALAQERPFTSCPAAATPSQEKAPPAVEDRRGSAGDFEDAFDSMTREWVDGFLVPSSPLTNARPEALAALALRHKIPGMFGNKDMSRRAGSHAFPL